QRLRRPLHRVIGKLGILGRHDVERGIGGDRRIADGAGGGDGRRAVFLRGGRAATGKDERQAAGQQSEGGDSHVHRSNLGATTADCQPPGGFVTGRPVFVANTVHSDTGRYRAPARGRPSGPPAA